MCIVDVTSDIIVRRCWGTAGITDWLVHRHVRLVVINTYTLIVCNTLSRVMGPSAEGHGNAAAFIGTAPDVAVYDVLITSGYGVSSNAAAFTVR